jgi:hypothetical protein
VEEIENVEIKPNATHVDDADLQTPNIELDEDAVPEVRGEKLGPPSSSSSKGFSITGWR